MNNTLCIIIGIAFVAFLLVVMATLVQGRMLMSSADKRLSKANDMVLSLASSADKLAETMVQMKDMMVERERVHEKELKTLSHHYEELRENHIQLTRRYEALEDRLYENYDTYNREILRSITDMAKKTTITNNTGLHKEK